MWSEPSLFERRVRHVPERRVVRPREPVPQRDPQLCDWSTGLQRQQHERRQRDHLRQQSSVPRRELRVVHGGRCVPAQRGMQDRNDLVHDRFIRLRRRRQQAARDVVRPRAIVQRREDDRRSGLQRERPVPDAGHDELRERIVQFRGNRLSRLLGGPNGL